MKLYHDEWTVWPLIPWSNGQPEQTFDAGCNGSALPEFLLDGIDRLSTEYDIDGVYLDGTTEPFGCINHYHGCGYELDGQWHPTYPVWANREFIRRMVTIFHEKRKDPLIDVHMSANLTIPTLAFVDSYWDGEQFEGYLHGQKDPRGLLPLDSFRAEFMGRQFGLRPEFLVYEGRPFTTDEALSVTLLHNVLVRATGLSEKLEEISAIWKAQDAFGVEQAEFLPYWSNGDRLSTAPEGVYASAYRRDKMGLLLVVSNLGKMETEAVVSLRADKLRITDRPAEAFDAITKTPVAIKREGAAWSLSVPLGPMAWKMIRVGQPRAE
jgi:Glycoside hydrolase 123, N-terminal domain